MSQCTRGSVIFWLLMMCIGANLCAAYPPGERSYDRRNYRGRYGLSLDSPNDKMSWDDWLLNEGAQQSMSDNNSGVLIRRITPKSVFVVPNRCPEDTYMDKSGGCVKVVKINQSAHLKFILKKLNSMYSSNKPNNNNNNYNNNNNSNNKESGPFHVSLPLSGFENKAVNSENVDTTLSTSTRLTTVLPTASETTSTSSSTTSTTSTTIKTKVEDFDRPTTYFREPNTKETIVFPDSIPEVTTKLPEMNGFDIKDTTLSEDYDGGETSTIFTEASTPFVETTTFSFYRIDHTAGGNRRDKDATTTTEFVSEASTPFTVTSTVSWFDMNRDDFETEHQTKKKSNQFETIQPTTNFQNNDHFFFYYY